MLNFVNKPMLPESCKRQDFTQQNAAKQSGFTLIEALVAISIFAFLGLGAYQILNNIIKIEEQSSSKSAQLAAVQKVIWQMGKDFRFIAGRAIRDENDEERPAVDLEGKYLIELTRRGWTNPLGFPRSVLQRVAYDINVHPDSDEQSSPFYEDESLYLLRHYWPVLDRGAEALPQTQVLLKDVSDFYLRFYQSDAASDKDPWSDELQLKTGLDDHTKAFDIPYAVEVNIFVGEDDLYSYIFPVGAGGN